MWWSWAVGWGAPSGGDVGEASSEDLARSALRSTCVGETELGRGWRIGTAELWPEATCDRMARPIVVRDGVASSAAPSVPDHASWQVDWAPGARRYEASASARGVSGLVHGAQFPGPWIHDLSVEGVVGWVVARTGLWAVAEGDGLTVRYSGRPHHRMCHLRPTEVMLAGGCGQVPLFGGTSWTVRAPSHEGWVVSGGGDELPVALPTLFAVRGAELAGSSGEIRIYGTEESRAPDADALAARLARDHAALSEAFGAFDARWDVLPVHYGSGYESTSGYPSIGVGYRMVGEGDALAHEVAHAWFGARVVPSFDQPGGHWHEALATWALMDTDPDAANLLLEFFVNRFRSQTRKRPSVALTQTAYAEASDGEKYGKGLAAMLTLDATYGRAEVVRAVALWVEQSAGRETTWTDVLAAVDQELGAEAAGRLRSWLDGRWAPRLALQGGVLVVDDDADPNHAIEGAILVTNASYDILAELPVQLGRGRVELGPPPEGWAYAFLAGELPVEGPDIYLFR